MPKNKRRATKEVQGQIWTEKSSPWKVVRGTLKRGKGRKGKVDALFRVLGEKIPFDALKAVQSSVKRTVGGRKVIEGIYVAHDSMGTPRYIGRGAIFSRLASHKKKHSKELYYFSFYVVKGKIHEREIETLLIRAAGASLYFNERKKRIDIRPGNISDYEAGTNFVERQQKRGRKRKRATPRSR